MGGNQPPPTATSSHAYITIAQAGNQHPGRNDGLGLGAELVREVALENGGTVVDFHGPMTAFNPEQQKKDTAYTIVGQDRMHPGT